MSSGHKYGWLAPWLLSALATLHLSMAWPEPIPALCAVGVLVWSAALRRPRAVPGAVPWLLVIPFVLWWVRLSLAKDPRPDELLSIVSWYLVLLSSIQVLAGTRAGGWLAWNALAAVLLAGFRPDAARIILVAAIVLLVLVQSRLDGERVGSSRFRYAWFAAIVPAVFLSVATRWIDIPMPHQGFEKWRSPHRAKGFSSTLRLGGGFGQDPDPSDDDVVLRLWSAKPPRYLKGAVFDVYARGHWTRSEGWSDAPSSRVELEYSVYCHVSDTMAPPSGWASASEPTEGYLLVPPGSGCVGVVSDSIRRTGSGIWRLPGDEIARGWMWFPGEIPSQVRESERAIPHEYAGLIDTAMALVGVAGLPPGEALRKIRSWLDRDFHYSLQPEERQGEDPLRTFLRERQGYCEHYATLAALMARGCGIPSRVVTGYAYPEPSGGAWLLRRSNAHAWVELAFPQRGWVTWDPTPAGGSAPLERSLVRRWSDALGTRMVAIWHGLRDGAWRIALSDAIEAWTQGRGFAWGLVPVLAVVAWLLFRTSRKRSDSTVEADVRRWRIGLERVESRLRREGHVRESGETIGAFLTRLPVEAHPQSRKFLEAYQKERWLRHGPPQ